MKKLLFAFLLFLSCYSDMEGFQTNSKPNIFFVYCDDLGMGDLSIEGHPAIKTPNIDNFAANSRRMRMYSGSAVCSPSRVALLTGRHPNRTGVYLGVSNPAFSIDDRDVTIATALRNNGYHTVHSGKWHVSARNDPNDRGFNNYYRSANKTAWEIFDSAKVFLQARDVNAPVFAHIALHETHTPVVDKLPPPMDTIIQFYGYDQIVSDPACHLRDEVRYAALDQNNLKWYYGIVSNMDKAFGDFISWVDTEFAGQDNIIIFSSDNGPERSTHSFGTPGCDLSGKKRWLFEGGVRVPGYVQRKGTWDDGQEIDTPISFLDMFDTFVSLSDSDVYCNQSDGEDVTEIIDGTKTERDRPIYQFFYASGVANPVQGWPEAGGDKFESSIVSQDGRWKLMANMYPYESGSRMDWIIRDIGYEKYMLFDLENDSVESQDVKLLYPQVYQTMRTLHEHFDNSIRLNSEYIAF